MTMVDHYAPLFFLEVSSMQPEELCDGAGLCSKVRMSSLSGKQNKCDLCHNAVDEVLVKLKDPDTKVCSLTISATTYHINCHFSNHGI